MDNVIAFPGKDARQWAGIAEGLAPYLKQLGATPDESTQLLALLQGRWERLSAPFSVKCPHTFPSPLTPAQEDAFYVALRTQATTIADHYKWLHAQALLDFARLEFRLLRSEAHG